MAAKTPAPRQPKGVPFGVFGSAKAIPEKYLFGTDEEIADRIAEGYRDHGTDPANAAPSFAQIRPGPTAQDANRPAPRSYGGDSKFGSPRRYTQMEGMPGGGMGMAGAPPSPGGGMNPAMMLAQLIRKRGGGKHGRKGKRKKKQMLAPAMFRPTHNKLPNTDSRKDAGSVQNKSFQGKGGNASARPVKGRNMNTVAGSKVKRKRK